MILSMFSLYVRSNKNSLDVSVTDFIDTNVHYSELGGVSSPPFNFQNTYGYKVKVIDTNTGRVNESSVKYFVTGECSDPGCGS